MATIPSSASTMLSVMVEGARPVPALGAPGVLSAPGVFAPETTSTTSVPGDEGGTAVAGAAGAVVE